jgi:8-hydroxy-5-deazaflavin:NADPH oxidoreductase
VKIAIIGAGNVGTALASSMTRAGHEVSIAATHHEHAEAAATAAGAVAAESNTEAVRDAEVVVLAVPYTSARDEVAPAIRDAVAGKVVVDVTNPLKPDYSGLVTENTSAAEEIQQQLPEASVVKAFNTLFASVQASPEPRVDAYVAGDDGKAKQLVMSLAESMGFSPLDVGPLANARHLEGMAFINIGLNAGNGWAWNTAWKLER